MYHASKKLTNISDIKAVLLVNVNSNYI